MLSTPSAPITTTTCNLLETGFTHVSQVPGTRRQVLKNPRATKEHISEFTPCPDLFRKEVWIVFKNDGKYDLEHGFLLKADLSQNRLSINFDLKGRSDRLVQLEQPRGIALHGDFLVIAQFFSIAVLNKDTLDVESIIENTDFNCLHDIALSPDGVHCVTASTNNGCFFEIDLQSTEVRLVHSLSKPKDGESRLLNSVSYGYDSDILTTERGNGHAWRFTQDGKYVLFAENLGIPHGFRTDNFFNGYRVTNSQQPELAGAHLGETVVFFDHNCKPIHLIEFSDPSSRLKGRVPWLQNVTPLDVENSIYLAIDCSAGRLRIFDLENRLYRDVAYAEESDDKFWRPHEVIAV